MHELQKKYERQIKEMVSVCRALADDKYVTSHGGNVSWAVDRPARIDSNIIITPTKKFKGSIEFDDVCITDYHGNVLYAPQGSKPTSELPFHLLLFHERPDIASIVHAHPPHTTAFATNKGINYLSWPILPEPTTEVGPVCVVPYSEPGTEKQANNFKGYLDKYNAFLIESHGIVVVSRENVERTMQLVDLVECTAQTILSLLKLGEIKSIPKEEVENLEKTMKARDLSLPGKPGVWKRLSDCYNFEEIRG